MLKGLGCLESPELNQFLSLLKNEGVQQGSICISIVVLGELFVKKLLNLEVIVELFLNCLAIIIAAGQFARPTVHFLSIEYNNSLKRGNFQIMRLHRSKSRKHSPQPHSPEKLQRVRNK